MTLDAEALPATVARHHHDDNGDTHAVWTMLANLHPAWHARAACRGRTATMFPEKAADVPAALAVCDGCPVRAECAEQGRTEWHGIWGGSSGRERERQRRKPIPHNGQRQAHLLAQMGAQEWTAHQLVAVTGTDVRNVQRALVRLEARGLVERRRTGGNAPDMWRKK